MQILIYVAEYMQNFVYQSRAKKNRIWVNRKSVGRRWSDACLSDRCSGTLVIRSIFFIIIIII